MLSTKIKDCVLAAHTFSGCVFMIATGRVSKATVVNTLGLDAGEEAELTSMGAYYVTLTATEKQSFHGLVESSAVLLQKGLITEVNFNNFLHTGS